jgi:hypothetical protein
MQYYGINYHKYHNMLFIILYKTQRNVNTISSILLNNFVFISYQINIIIEVILHREVILNGWTFQMG